MKPGALLINASRGTVVDIPALCDALASNHIAGAAIDVFPAEPATNSDPFNSPLCEFDNVLLTPHIGGSTQEAQENIGDEVAGKLAKYSDNGSTLSAVNFPEVSLPAHGDETRRLLHIHENRPGILTSINQIFAEQNINIAAQYLQTSAEIGYVVIDVETENVVLVEKALQLMKAIPGPFVPVCCISPIFPVSSDSGKSARLFGLTVSDCYQRHTLPGVIISGNGISQCSTGKSSTNWQSCANPIG